MVYTLSLVILPCWKHVLNSPFIIPWSTIWSKFSWIKKHIIKPLSLSISFIFGTKNLLRAKCRDLGDWGTAAIKLLAENCWTDRQSARSHYHDAWTNLNLCSPTPLWCRSLSNLFGLLWMWHCRDFHCHNCCFVSGSYSQIMVPSPLTINVGRFKLLEGHDTWSFCSSIYRCQRFFTCLDIVIKCVDVFCKKD